MNSAAKGVIPWTNPSESMPINGLMVTLSEDPAAAEAAQTAMRQRRHIACGERQDRWLPLVTEARDDREARELHGWLESLPGVDQVDVILVGFNETNS